MLATLRRRSRTDRAPLANIGASNNRRNDEKD
jgi:hypothetical protein